MSRVCAICGKVKQVVTMLAIVIEKQDALLKLMFKRFQSKLMVKALINTFALNVLRHLRSLNSVSRGLSA